MDKIAIVGVGRVGESTAQILANNELCIELVLVGHHAGAAEGVALDIQESAPHFGFDTHVTGHADPAAMAGAELVIISAGAPRKPGMSRSELLLVNVPTITSVVEDIVRYAPDAMVLMVSNPVDILTFHVWKLTGWERRRVFGLSGVLDAGRMASFIAQETGISVKDIYALVLGGHGDAMVPLPRYSHIGGVPLDQFLAPEAIARIVEHTRKGGAEILTLKKTSSAYDAPGASIAAMVDAISHNRKRFLPCVAILDGEYGQERIAMGVPSVLGAGGVEQVVELSLTDDEAAQFKGSADLVRTDLEKLS